MPPSFTLQTLNQLNLGYVTLSLIHEGPIGIELNRCTLFINEPLTHNKYLVRLEIARLVTVLTSCKY